MGLKSGFARPVVFVGRESSNPEHFPKSHRHNFEKVREGLERTCERNADEHDGRFQSGRPP